MVFCVVAVVVFGILGIFSASHRKLAKEAFDCVFRMTTLRPCNSAFDEKIKSKITGKLMKKNPKFAKFVYKKFTIISWILVILMFVSFIYTVVAAYNLIVYGSCTPENPQGCILTYVNPVTKEAKHYSSIDVNEEQCIDIGKAIKGN